MIKIDARGWVTIGLFALGFAELGMLGYCPSLEDNKLFAAIMASTWSGGILAAASYYLGSSKDSSAKTDTIANMAVKATLDAQGDTQ